MAIIIDGKKISKKLLMKIKKEIEKCNFKPGLAVVLVGDDNASQIYVRNKKEACAFVGIESFAYNLPSNTEEEGLLKLIGKLNRDKKIHGILVQLPLPKQINKEKVLDGIFSEKDVDGFHPFNIGKLYSGHPSLLPCTPAGIIELLKAYKIKIEGKHAVVVGRSNIVGKPVAQMLLNEGATVTICHSKTKDLKSITKQADILVSAVGIPRLITKDMLKKGVTIIDVGMNRDENNKLCGDVDFEKVKNICSAITPVPGGVGPMTIAMLMKNCMAACKQQSKK